MLKDTSGQIVVIFALACTAIFTLVALAIDPMRGNLNQAQLQQAVDPAVAGAASQYNLEIMDGVAVSVAEESATDVAEKLFQINIAQLEFRGNVPTPLIAPTSPGSGVFMMTVNAGVPTSFAKVFGKDVMPVAATSCATGQVSGGSMQSMITDCTGAPAAALPPPSLPPANPTTPVVPPVVTATCVDPESEYRTRYPAVQAAINNPTSGIISGLDHWTRIGQYDGRDGVCFNPVACGDPEIEYKRLHTDVQGYIDTGFAGITSGYDHWIRYGQHEGRDGVCFAQDLCQNPEARYTQVNTDIAIHINAGTVASGYDHWVRYGQYEGRAGSCWPAVPCGDHEREYLRTHSDVPIHINAGTVSSGYDHWIRFGQYEGRDGVCFAPNACADPEASYITQNPDVQIHINNAVVTSGYDHWRRFGQYEGRAGSCWPTEPCAVPEYNYLTVNTDIQIHINAGTVTSGHDHWLRYGQYEGRSGSCWPADPCVNAERHYVQVNADVPGYISSGIVTSGHNHWLLYGQFEGRSGSCWPADPCANAERNYLENNADVPTYIANGTVSSGHDHWRNYGQYEGRSGSCWPTEVCAQPERAYIQANPDVQNLINTGTVTNGFDHWTRFGHAQGRTGSCWAAPQPVCDYYTLDMTSMVTLFPNSPLNTARIDRATTMISGGGDSPSCLANFYNDRLSNCTAAAAARGGFTSDVLNCLDGTVHLNNSCNIVPQGNLSCGTANRQLRVIQRALSPISLQWNAGKVFESPTITSFKVNPDSSHKFTWRGSSNMPLLVWDETGDGNIKDGKQLFGDHTFGKSWDHGYHALGSLDANKDGIIKGDELINLSLWFDANRDGVSDAGEVKRLAEVNVTELYYTDYTRADNGDWELEKGYKRIKNGQEEILPSIDWYANEVPSLTHLFYSQYGE